MTRATHALESSSTNQVALTCITEFRRITQGTRSAVTISSRFSQEFIPELDLERFSTRRRRITFCECSSPSQLFSTATVRFLKQQPPPPPQKTTHSVFFDDHGTSGALCWPEGCTLTGPKFEAAIQAMSRKQMFAELVIYIEACYAGSVFYKSKFPPNVYVTTASPVAASSFAYNVSSSRTKRAKERRKTPTNNTHTHTSGGTVRFDDRSVRRGHLQFPVHPRHRGQSTQSHIQ